MLRRPFHPVFRLLRLCALCTAIPAAAHAEETTRFDVLYRGLPVAEITLFARDNGVAYALAGQVRATGLASVFGRVRFDLQAEGRWSGDAPHPARYVEAVNTGRRVSSVELHFDEDRTRIAHQHPAPGPEAVPPARALGHADPLSALWRMVRGGPRDRLCDFTMPLYDGARRSELALDRVAGTTCRGRYTRVDGFPAQDMAERRHFPFTVHYAEASGQFVLTQVEAASLLGPIRIVRRD